MPPASGTSVFPPAVTSRIPSPHPRSTDPRRSMPKTGVDHPAAPPVADPATSAAPTDRSERRSTCHRNFPLTGCCDDHLNPP